MQQTNANSVLKSFSKVCKKHWLKCSSVCKILQKTIQKAHLNVGHAYLYVIKMVWKLRRRDLQKAHLMVPLLPDLLRQKCQQICFCHPPGPFLYPKIFAKSAQDFKIILPPSASIWTTWVSWSARPLCSPAGWTGMPGDIELWFFCDHMPVI